MRLVLASNNARKLAELQAPVRAACRCELVAQASCGIAEADEPHGTFVENALAKARHAARRSGLPAIADDSGLCVDALGGAPGVASAHYAAAVLAARRSRSAARVQDAANNRAAAAAHARHGRPARALRQHAGGAAPCRRPRAADRRRPLGAARLLHAPRGSGGFGYDPLMFIPTLGRSVAELTPAAEERAQPPRAGRAADAAR